MPVTMFLPYVSSSVELFREKHQKTQHCILFLVLLVSNYFYSKNSENFGTRRYLKYWGRDTCGILSRWVIFEIFIPVSVKRAVVLVVTPFRLLQIYHPFFFCRKEGGGRFLHLRGRNRVCCYLQNIFKILPDFLSRKMKFLKNWVTV